MSTDLRILDKARQIVSKKKKRYQEDGYDLDLSYITPRIIAMGFPSTGWEAVYRNPLRQVQRFLSEHHGDDFKVYNLCSERDYDLVGTFPLTERFPFDDHSPCPVEMLIALIESIASYLEESASNVVAVHCKAGKGRTGMVVAALLLRLGICKTASEALAMFGERRTDNGKGVTIPSQRRYVQYFERLLHCVAEGGPVRTLVATLPRQEFELHGVRLTSIPVFTSMPGSTRCTPYFKVALSIPPPGDDPHVPWEQHQVFCFRQFQQSRGEDLKSYDCTQRYLYLDCSEERLRISGDVVLKFFAAHHLAKSERMCQVWLNTAFIRPGHRVVQFGRNRIDGVNKDKKCKRFSPDFALQFFLKSVHGPHHRESSEEEDSLPKRLHYEYSDVAAMHGSSIFDSPPEGSDNCEDDDEDDDEDFEPLESPHRKNRRSMTDFHSSKTVGSDEEGEQEGPGTDQAGKQISHKVTRRQASAPMHLDGWLEEQAGARQLPSPTSWCPPAQCTTRMGPDGNSKAVQKVMGESSSGIEGLSDESDD